ncbi:hypothetical protein BLA29_012800, partial [Euroglyphus maynei]
MESCKERMKQGMTTKQQVEYHNSMNDQINNEAAKRVECNPNERQICQAVDEGKFKHQEGPTGVSIRWIRWRSPDEKSNGKRKCLGRNNMLDREWDPDDQISLTKLVHRSKESDVLMEFVEFGIGQILLHVMDDQVSNL